MTLSEELAWRGFVNQTTFKDISMLDAAPLSFYWGVDPSAASMTIGNLAAGMMVKHFIRHGHKAYLLVGGATGLIGDPDGKTDERHIKAVEEIARNKQAIANQYRHIFSGMEFKLVDNYDWFKDMNYLTFLRDVGKHVPMRQMLARDFVQSRLGEDSAGISYAEFSYALIQGYDFLHLYQHHGVTLQVAASDQWGNSIAGVDLIRRVAAADAHVWTTPLIINKATGVKFGKSEAGAIWLDPQLTTPSQFYQFWINVDDDGVEDYLKVFTEFDKPAIETVMAQQRARPASRLAQQALAASVTKLVHGDAALNFAKQVTEVLVGNQPLASADAIMLDELKQQLPHAILPGDGSIVEALVLTGMASSNSDARRLLQTNAIAVNGKKINREQFQPDDFAQGKLLLRKGKKYKDAAIIEQA